MAVMTDDSATRCWPDQGPVMVLHKGGSSTETPLTSGGSESSSDRGYFQCYNLLWIVLLCMRRDQEYGSASELSR